MASVKVLVAGNDTAALLRRALSPDADKGVDMRVIAGHRGWQSRTSMQADDAGEGVDFSACAVNYAISRNEAGRRFYLDKGSSFYRRMNQVAAEAETLFAAFRPDYVVVFHGFAPVAQIALAKAVKFKVPVLYLENGIVPTGGFILDPHAPYFMPHGANMIERHWPRPELDEAQLNAIRNFLAQWREGQASKYNLGEAGDEQKQVKDFLQHDKKPVVLFALQVPGDMNVALALPSFWQGSYAAWVEAVVAAMPCGWKCIVKSHPMSDYQPQFDGNNIITVKDVGLQSLLAQADCVITLTSNVGLEAMMMEKPVIAPNAAYYTGKNLTLALSKPDDLPDALEQSRTFNPPEALRLGFLHHVLLEYHFHPGEQQKLLERLPLARVPEGQPPLFQHLPKQYRLYKQLIDSYNTYRKEGKRHRAALKAARAEYPELVWPDAWNISMGRTIKNWYRRLRRRQHHRWLRRRAALRRMIGKQS